MSLDIRCDSLTLKKIFFLKLVWKKSSWSLMLQLTHGIALTKNDWKDNSESLITFGSPQNSLLIQRSRLIIIFSFHPQLSGWWGGICTVQVEGPVWRLPFQSSGTPHGYGRRKLSKVVGWWSTCSCLGWFSSSCF